MKWVSKYADEMVEAERVHGKGVWIHKPIEVVLVDGKQLIIDGHHRIEAAKQVGFKGTIPFIVRPIEEVGYTLEELREFIK